VRSADVVIVGCGIGGVRAAQALRQQGFSGTIALIGAEPEMPYDRPPLSKAYLLGEASEDDLRLLPPLRLEELAVELMLGDSAVELDRAKHQVWLASGQSISYGRLVVATGARPHRLRLLDGFDNALFLRTLGDARRLSAALAVRQRVGIVGAGFIGLEIAAVARELGCDVTVVEAAATPLAAALGTEAGGWIQHLHEARGVRFACSASLVRGIGDRQVEALELSDGSRVDVDVVIVGVGVAPNVEWLGAGGLELHRGLVCDATGRSSDPSVFGVGDVACWHVDGRCRPAGHWTGACEQAQAVAAALLGKPAPPAGQDGYFWSDQYEVRIQFAGRASEEAPVSIISGALEAHRFVAQFGEAGRPTAVLAVNCPREFVRAGLALRSAARLPEAA
jgi:NADPH-dependent 2,4-dienoyl-CoA reductase/sulfur reductase-like enzyme